MPKGHKDERPAAGVPKRSGAAPGVAAAVLHCCAWAHCTLVRGSDTHVEGMNCAVATQHAVPGTGGAGSWPRHRCGPDQTRATMEAKTSDREESKDAKEDSIVAKVGRYFFEDSSFSQTFEAWVSKNAPRIDPTLNDDEYPLEYTTLYEEFKKLYEGLLEDYIEREGSSTEAFYAELREATERDEDSSEALMGQIMLATTDFDVFMLMMKESRRQYDVKEKSRHK